MIGAIFLQVILIIINAIFACAEVAVTLGSEAKLEKLSEEGNKKAKRALPFITDSTRAVSTIQVVIALASLMGSAYAAESFSKPLAKWVMSLGAPGGEMIWRNICIFVITLLLSYFVMVIGRLVPKRLAMKDPEKVAMGLSGALGVATVLCAPFVFVMTASANLLLRLFGIDPHDKHDDVTEEDIISLLDAGSEQGNIDSIENEMIQNIFEFDDISISEVCTHRRDVNFLYKEDGIEAWRELVASTRHNYYPVCEDSDDNVVGILSVRKFFRLEGDDVETAMVEAVDKPFFVPENMKADVLLDQMKKTRNYFAVVIDEYGGTRGVITVHDLLELLVGALGDKDDETVEEICSIGEDKWEILGSASIGEVEEALDIELGDEDNDTFGGYILGLLGAIPDDGTTADTETDDLRIHVASISDHRIEKTVVVKKTEEEKAAEAKAREEERAEKDREKTED